MDIATLVGIGGGIAVIIMALVLGGNIGGFLDIPSVLIVFGGTLMNTMLNFPMQQFVSIFKTLPKIFYAQEDDPLEIIKQCIRLAVVVRKDGQLALEHEARSVQNPFFQKGLLLVADGMDNDTLSSILNLQIMAISQRHKVGQEVFKAIGKWAPAFGMIGTLIGLVQMLGTLNDPSKIGPSMAVAILTTLYGAVLSNMIALPIAAKLKQRTDQEVLVNMVIIEGLNGLQSGLNPRLMEEKLKSFLATKKQKIELNLK